MGPDRTLSRLGRLGSRSQDRARCPAAPGSLQGPPGRQRRRDGKGHGRHVGRVADGRARRRLFLADCRCRRPCPRKPGEGRPCDRHVLRAGRSHVVGFARSSRARQGQGRKLHRREPRAAEALRLRPARHVARRGAYARCQGRSAAGDGGFTARRAAGHSRTACRLGHSAPHGDAVRRARNPPRRPGLPARPRGAEPRRPQAGVREVLGILRWFQQLARRGLCLEDQGRRVPHQGAQLSQHAGLPARRAEHSRGRLPQPGGRNEQGPAAAAPLFRPAAPDPGPARHRLLRHLP